MTDFKATYMRLMEIERERRALREEATALERQVAAALGVGPQAILIARNGKRVKVSSYSGDFLENFDPEPDGSLKVFPRVLCHVHPATTKGGFHKVKTVRHQVIGESFLLTPEEMKP
jgi:hypothetical protein